MSLTRTRPLLSEVVRSELRRAIIEGEFAPGSKLPNEELLRDRFSVSRITLREGVRALMEDGYVVRRHGAGTFVTQGPALRNSLDTNFSYTEYFESNGISTNKKILDARAIRADDELASEMELPAGSEMIEVRRVRMAGERPAIYSIDSIPTDIVSLNEDRKAYKGSLYRLLAERNHPVDHARAVLLPVVADEELAGILDVAVGTPLQHMRQIDIDGRGRPVMRSLEWHVPSVIELRVYRRGPGPISVE